MDTRERAKTTHAKFQKLLKKKKKCTVYQVSKATGIAFATFAAWDKGDYTPKIDKLQKIAKYFDVPLEELI